MWELHLKEEQYEEALVFCKSSAQKDAGESPRPLLYHNLIDVEYIIV